MGYLAREGARLLLEGITVNYLQGGMVMNTQTGHQGTAMTYEDCYNEIKELRESEDYDDWGSQRRPNSGCVLTRKSLEMSDEFIDDWAKKIDGLFSERQSPATTR
jgi:hypothetical protein